jgi:hypothetical protein
MGEGFPSPTPAADKSANSNFPDSTLHYVIAALNCTSYNLTTLTTKGSSLYGQLQTDFVPTRGPQLRPTSIGKQSNAIPISGRGGIYDCETLRIPHCLDSRFAVNCEILATCSSTYSPVRTSQEAHSVSIK